MKNPVDAHVGKRVRYQRHVQRMTQQALAASLGIKFQQVQKYETGANRISASRLWDIAHALDVPIGFFFDGLDKPIEADGAGGDFIPDHDPIPKDPLADREALEVLRLYYSAPEAHRRPFLALMRASGT